MTTSRCFVVVPGERTLTRRTDALLRRRRPRVDRVEVRELMIETDQTARVPRIILAKVDWRAKHHAHQDVVVGELQGRTFRLIDIPTENSAIGFLFPQRVTATLFGGDPNSPRVPRELWAWMEGIVNATLPDLLRERLP